jgi:hypothetical protein
MKPALLLIDLQGVQFHGRVRTRVIDAYPRRYGVWIAGDGAGSDDPLHAAITQRYLAESAERFVPVPRLLSSLEP